MRVEATLVVRRDGMVWPEVHSLHQSKLDDPLDTYRFVAFRDGTGEEASAMAWMAPDVTAYTAQ